MSGTSPTRRRLRAVLICAAILVLLPLAAMGAFVLTFDANAYKARIVDAVRRSTGRELVLAGPLSLAPSLYPTIEARDVALANMAGGSRPQMMSIGRLRAQVALFPLLRRQVEIESVTLVQPDILIETDAQGRGNWVFKRPEPPSSTTPPAAQSSPGSRPELTVRHVRVQDGRLTWRNGATGQSATIDLPAADADIGDGPVHVAAAMNYAGLPFALDAAAGTLAQLRGEAPGEWPLSLRLTQADAVVTVAGAAELPIQMHGYRGRVDAVIPDLARLAPALARADLPPLHDVRFGAGVTSMLGLPAPSDVTLHIGASDLPGVAPGLHLAQLDATWPKFDQPIHVAADGQLSGAPWRLASGAMPIGGGIALRGLALSLGGSDLAGDLAVTRSAVPAFRGTVVSKRLDADELRRLWQPPPAQPAPPAPAPSAQAPPPVAAAPAPTVISDRPLPFASLRRADADVQATVGTLRAGGADYHGLAGHAVLRNGALRLDPVTVEAPEGHVDLSFSTDASQSPPPVALALRSAAFALHPLLLSLGLPAESDAAVEIDLALRSAGSSPHALAAALDGHAGLAMVDGEVENALLTHLLGNVLRAANVPVEGSGRSHVRCLAIRLDAAGGKLDVRTLKLDSTRLVMDGSGTADLGAETLALKLRPQLLLGGTGVLVPVQLGGTFAHPQAGLDSPGVAGRVGVVIGGAAPADSCAADLAAARDGHAGPMPAAVQPKAARGVKPADLLRSFLR